MALLSGQCRLNNLAGWLSPGVTGCAGSGFAQIPWSRRVGVGVLPGGAPKRLTCPTCSAAAPRRGRIWQNTSMSSRWWCLRRILWLQELEVVFEAPFCAVSRHCVKRLPQKGVPREGVAVVLAGSAFGFFPPRRRCCEVSQVTS